MSGQEISTLCSKYGLLPCQKLTVVKSISIGIRDNKKTTTQKTSSYETSEIRGCAKQEKKKSHPLLMPQFSSLQNTSHTKPAPKPCSSILMQGGGGGVILQLTAF